MDRPELSSEEALELWLRAWVGSDRSAALTGQLDLHDGPAMLRVAQALVDRVIRHILPLPKEYRTDPPYFAEIAALPPIVDAPSRQAVRALVAARCKSAPLNLRSALAALGDVESMALARSPEAVREAWQGLFYSPGALYMAVYRTARQGADREAIAAVLVAAMQGLAQGERRPPG